MLHLVEQSSATNSADNDIEAEARARFGRGNLEARFRSGPTNREFMGLTSLGFANYFGPELANEVNPEVIVSEGFSVEQIAGGYLVLVSDDLFDVVDNYSEFNERRAHLKSLFREGLFMLSDKASQA